MDVDSVTRLSANDRKKLKRVFDLIDEVLSSSAPDAEGPTANAKVAFDSVCGKCDRAILWTTTTKSGSWVALDERRALCRARGWQSGLARGRRVRIPLRWISRWTSETDPRAESQRRATDLPRLAKRLRLTPLLCRPPGNFFLLSLPRRLTRCDWSYLRRFTAGRQSEAVSEHLGSRIDARKVASRPRPSQERCWPTPDSHNKLTNRSWDRPPFLASAPRLSHPSG
jgi:hypothetical protein